MIMIAIHFTQCFSQYQLKFVSWHRMSDSIINLVKETNSQYGLVSLMLIWFVASSDDSVWPMSLTFVSLVSLRLLSRMSFRLVILYCIWQMLPHIFVLIEEELVDLITQRHRWFHRRRACRSHTTTSLFSSKKRLSISSHNDVFVFIEEEFVYLVAQLHGVDSITTRSRRVGVPAVGAI